MTAAAVIAGIGGAAGSASAAPPSPFDPDYEVKVLAHILRDTSFMRQCDDLVDRDYFESASTRFLVGVAKNHFKKYASTPDIRTLAAYIKKASATGRLKSGMIDDIKETLGQAFRESLGDVNYVVEQVSSFARHKALQSSIMRVIDDMEKAEKLGQDFDFSQAEKEFSKALMIGTNEANNGYDYFESISARTEAREERKAGLAPDQGITSGYPALDTLLYHKGWGRGEMVLFMGPPKSGKSTALGQFGINASIAGFDVLYVTLEVADLIMADRIDATLADTKVHELTDKSKSVKDEIEKLAPSSGKFIIHQYPTGSFTPKQLCRLIEHYKARGIVFDAVVVDYGDIMAPDFRSTDPIENSKSIYVGMRAAAMMYDVALLSATQTNRDGARNATAGMTDVAEDFNKIRIADLVISINKTEEEKAAGEARLYFAASRNQRSDITVRIGQDLEKMKFLTKILDIT